MRESVESAVERGKVITDSPCGTIADLLVAETAEVLRLGHVTRARMTQKSHYLFEDHFCLVLRRPNEKVRVEQTDVAPINISCKEAEGCR